MLKSERRFARSLSFSYNPILGKCRHPQVRPLGIAEAEQLLRNAPLKEEPSPMTEEGETMEEYLDSTKPKLPYPNNKIEERKVKKLEDLTKQLMLTDAQLLHFEKRMLDDVNRGLNKQTNHTTDVKSFVTYVHELPTGREDGRFLALDLGGTNFRVIEVELEAGSRSVRMKSHKYEVSQELMLGSGTKLFDFMADKLYHFLEEHNLLGHSYSLGFTFSFPTRQISLSKAELSCWTKGYVCEGVEGQEVGRLIEEAIQRRGGMDIAVDAILNDTTGCLLACAYKRPECAIGVILGTGTNASYVEDMKLAELYEGEAPPDAKKVVINTEWGAFGTNGSLDIIRLHYDHELDAQSRNPGKQIYEKLISGMYLGEVARMVMVHAIREGVMFSGRAREVLAVLGKRDAFQSRFCSNIEADPNRDNLDGPRAVFKELGLDKWATNFDCKVARYICECVSGRAADLAGAGVAALINKIGKRRITVGIDGSLYKFHPTFGRKMRRTVARLVCDCIQFEIILSEDGSGRGAALAAAVGAKQMAKMEAATKTAKAAAAKIIS